MQKLLAWMPGAWLAVMAASVAATSGSIVAAKSTPATILGGDPAKQENPDQPEKSTKLEKGLAAISVESISEDLFIIASDEYGGRDTPSEGQRKAAAFIAARLQELEFTPGYKDGYLYPYTLQHNGLVREKTSLSITAGDETLEPEFGTGYSLFTPGLHDSEGKGKVVWVGDGKKEDFERANCKGAWALVVYAPAPTGSNIDRDTSAFRQRAQKADAVGLIILPGPEATAEATARRIKGSSERLLTGSVRYPGSNRRRRPRPGAGDPFPTVLASHELAIKLLGLIGAQDPSSFKPGKKLKLRVAAKVGFKGDKGEVEVHNVVGLWEGEDPKLRREVIIISAHYDHVGWRSDGEIYNGADDNGSGTCGVLALAAALKAYGPMKRTVMLIWVSAEEKGLLGSKAWSENPWLPKGYRPVANLNIDMIGRNAPEKLMITPTKNGRFSKMYNGIVARAEEFRELEGFAELESADLYYNRSDQANFEKLGIPVAFLFTDVHEDYHKVSDDPDKLDCNKASRVVRLVLRILDTLQEKKLGV